MSHIRLSLNTLKLSFINLYLIHFALPLHTSSKYHTKLSSPLVEIMSHSQSRNPPCDLLDFLIRPGQYYPIYTSLISCLRVNDMITLARTCKQLSALSERIPIHHWDFIQAVNIFAKDFDRFIAQVKQHDAVLCSAEPFHFFGAIKANTPHMMDIFVSSKDSVDVLAEYLCSVEGYRTFELDSFFSYADDLFPASTKVRRSIPDSRVYMY